MKRIRHSVAVLLSICMVVMLLVPLPLLVSAATGGELAPAASTTDFDSAMVMDDNAAANPFRDVSPDNWFYNSAMYVYSRGLMKGMSEDTFAPQTQTNRAMLVTILYRMEGEPEIGDTGETAASADNPGTNQTGSPTVFKDVPAGSWYTDAVAWAAKEKIVNGVEADRFAPEVSITREQIATIFFRYSTGKGIDTTGKADLSGYADQSTISPYAVEAIEWAVADGLIQGRGENQLAPEANATRAEIATILMRYCQKYVDNNSQGPTTENFIDEPLPDIEIGNFRCSESDILIGTTETVEFYADIFQEIELGEEDVAVYDQDDQLLGYMSILSDWNEEYILTVNLSSNTVGEKEYYCKVKDVRSEPCTISFYREFTDEDLTLRDDVLDELQAVTAGYENDEGYVNESDLDVIIKKLREKMDQLENAGKVESFTFEDITVSVNTATGYPFIYTVPVAGWMAASSYTSNGMEESSYDGYSGTGKGLSIATFEPFYNDRSINPRLSNGEINEYEGSSTGATDLAAQTMVSKLGQFGYSFDGNYDNEDVSIDRLKHISDYDVILWAGHGTASQKNGSVLYTGEKITTAKSEYYQKDIQAGRIVDGGNYGTYGVTGKFFKENLDEGSLNGAFIYLGACCSINDKYNNRNGKNGLAQSLIDKGAAAVVGNTAFTGANTSFSFQRDMLELMCEKNSDTGKYYTAGEAFQFEKRLYYKDKNKKDEYLTLVYVDGVECKSKAMMYPSDPGTAENYRLVDFGWIGGNVIKAESGDGISLASIEAYSMSGKLVSLTWSMYFGSLGGYAMRLPEGDYILKISASGRRSLKMYVHVTADEYTYYEAVTLPKPGYFNGNVNGLVKYTLTMQGLEGASLTFRKNWYNSFGKVIQSEVTNENGYYETRLSSGAYTVIVQKEGLDSRLYNILILPWDTGQKDFWIGPEQQSEVVK